MHQLNRALTDLQQKTAEATEAEHAAATAAAQLADLHLSSSTTQLNSDAAESELRSEVDDLKSELQRCREALEDAQTDANRRRELVVTFQSEAAAARKAAGEDRRKAAKAERGLAEKERRLEVVTQREAEAHTQLQVRSKRLCVAGCVVVMRHTVMMW